MKRKEIISEKASRYYDNIKAMLRELEQDLVEYIREFGDNGYVNLEDAEYPTYTTLNRWAGTEATSVKGLKVSGGGNLIVIDEDGYEHTNDNFTLDTIVDICYCVDCWATEE